jgi:hypothetical protein
MIKRGRKIRKYLLSVKKSVKNIRAGIKKLRDILKNIFSLLNNLYIQRISIHRGARHQNIKNT